MISIFHKEIITFFSSLIGYITIMVFLVVTGMFIWVFPETNLLDHGFSNLDGFFTLAPWIFIFLIPAVTMRLFSEEKKTGTIEILVTQPLTDLNIILGKYLAAMFLVIFSLLPTLIYFFTIYMLGNPVGNLDTGATWGSYIGLLLLGSGFVAIGLFSSSITDNQIVAFITGMFLCFFFYIVFDYLSELEIFWGNLDIVIQQIGINAHYTSISRGVLDSRDVVYFLSLSIGFIMITKTVMESRKW
ncbi:MAG: gliding motility-associated ABC transporter permease subunit GldF [Bacteroidetes bacterium]|nr:gliding motility-associated ABC transporter permease subunit GldF [Bacteroidota bacterium]